MSNERGPRRPGSMSDADRALIGGRKNQAPALGVPTVSIDGETTPLPAEPRRLEELPAFARLSPELQDMFRVIHDTQREQDIALTRVFPSRHAAAEIVILREVVVEMRAAMSKMENIPSALHAHASQIRELQRETQIMQGTAVKIDSVLVSISKELHDMRIERVRQLAAVEAIESRFHNETKSLRIEIENTRSEIGKAEKRAETQSARIKSLEDDRLRVKAWAALIGALGMIVGWLVSRFGIGKG